MADRTFTVSVTQGKFFIAWAEWETLMAITFDSWLLTRDVRFACGGKTTEFDDDMHATATILLFLRLAQRMFIPVTSFYQRGQHFFPAHRLELVSFAQTLWSVIR